MQIASLCVAAVACLALVPDGVLKGPRNENPETQLRLEFVDPEGNPVAGVFNIWGLNACMNVFTDKNGVWTGAPESRELVLRIDANQYLDPPPVEVRLEPVEQVVHKIRLERGLEKTGIVRYRDGSPAEGVYVEIECEPSEDGCESSTAVTDASGRFRVTGLLEGMCRLEAASGDSHAKFQARSLADLRSEIEIERGADLIVEIEASIPAEFDSEHRQGRFRIDLVPPDARNWPPQQFTNGGECKFINLIPGDWRVEVQDLASPEFRVGSVSLMRGELKKHRVEIAPDSFHPVPFQVRVRDSEENPLPGVTVEGVTPVLTDKRGIAQGEIGKDDRIDVSKQGYLSLQVHDASRKARDGFIDVRMIAVCRIEAELTGAPEGSNPVVNFWLKEMLGDEDEANRRIKRCDDWDEVHEGRTWIDGLIDETVFLAAICEDFYSLREVQPVPGETLKIEIELPEPREVTGSIRIDEKPAPDGTLKIKFVGGELENESSVDVKDGRFTFVTRSQHRLSLTYSNEELGEFRFVCDPRQESPLELSATREAARMLPAVAENTAKTDMVRIELANRPDEFIDLSISDAGVERRVDMSPYGLRKSVPLPRDQYWLVATPRMVDTVKVYGGRTFIDQDGELEVVRIPLQPCARVEIQCDPEQIDLIDGRVSFTWAAVGEGAGAIPEYRECHSLDQIAADCYFLVPGRCCVLIEQPGKPPLEKTVQLEGHKKTFLRFP